MTKAILRNLSALLPLLLAGCAATTNSTASKPGEGKGYWVTESTPQTGSMQPRRYWVSTESGAATPTTGNGVNTYGGNVPTGIGSTSGALSGGGGAGGGGFGGTGGGGR